MNSPYTFHLALLDAFNGLLPTHSDTQYRFIFGKILKEKVAANSVVLDSLELSLTENEDRYHAFYKTLAHPSIKEEISIHVQQETDDVLNLTTYCFDCKALEETEKVELPPITQELLKFIAGQLDVLLTKDRLQHMVFFDKALKEKIKALSETQSLITVQSTTWQNVVLVYQQDGRHRELHVRLDCHSGMLGLYVTLALTNPGS